MLQIGGVSLNLMTESIVSVGKTVEIIDLKSQNSTKKTLSIQLPQSAIFMGVTVFSNRVYVCGGRNVFGQYILGEECPDVRT